MEKYYLKEQEVLVLRETYLIDNYLSIKIFDINYTKEIAVVTILIKGSMSDKHKSDTAYVDVHKYPWLKEFIEENDLGYPTGNYAIHEDNFYPEYRFYVNQFTSIPKDLSRGKMYG